MDQRYVPQVQNGRVINITQNPIGRFPLFDNNEPNDNFGRAALFGIQDCSPLSKVYFSKANVRYDYLLQ